MTIVAVSLRNRCVIDSVFGNAALSQRWLTEALLELAIEKLNRKCSYTTRTCSRPPDQIGGQRLIKVASRSESTPFR